MRRVCWLLVLVLCQSLMWSGCRREKPKPPKRRVVKRQKLYKPPRPRLPLGVKLFPEEVWVDGGKFVMGAPPKDKKKLDRYTRRHEVILRRMIAVWRYEVTQAEFLRTLRYNPSKFTECGSNCPVEQVNWHQAADFCNALSRKRGLGICYACRGKKKGVLCKTQGRFLGKRLYACSGYRLPTESEWEFIARAGSYDEVHPPARKGKGDRLKRVAWFGENSKVSYKNAFRCKDWEDPTKFYDCGPRPVGTREPNRLGVYDMLGNVFEWVHDGYMTYPQGLVQDPVGFALYNKRVRRGCSWFSDRKYCTVSHRFPARPIFRNGLVGFRPVRSLWISSQYRGGWRKKK